MARAYRGPYARPSTYPVPYATATVWGTGIDPIHSYYGEGPPLRMLGRSGSVGSSPVANQSPRDRSYQNAADSNSQNPPEELTWGYNADNYSVESFGMGANASPSTVAPGHREYMDDRPQWGNDAPDQRTRRGTGSMTPWNVTGAFMRAMRDGANRYRTHPAETLNGAPVTARPSSQLPNETVSEGWINKATSVTAYAHPSDPSQYEVQTSMRQRFGTRDNTRAQARSTDDPRAKIASRVEPMIEKVYSTGERLYDMFPYQQDEIERPFRFRTAGLGPANWMEANEITSLTPVQRTPPPDPAAGYPEVSEDYGYQPEDSMYYDG